MQAHDVVVNDLVARGDEVIHRQLVIGALNAHGIDVVRPELLVVVLALADWGQGFLDLTTKSLKLSTAELRCVLLEALTCFDQLTLETKIGHLIKEIVGLLLRGSIS